MKGVLKEIDINTRCIQGYGELHFLDLGYVETIVLDNV
jgi:hypothetical protein